MIFASMGQIALVIFLPALGVAAVVTAIYISSQYQAIINSTANGGTRIAWASESFLDKAFQVPLVVWLVMCAIGPTMIISGILARHFGVVSFGLPVIVFWLLMPIVQLSSLFSVSPWMPVNPIALRKMAGKAGTVFIFYGLSLFPVVMFGMGSYLCFTPNPLKIGGVVLGAILVAGAIFAYARLLGRMAFVCSFVGVKDEEIEESIPQYSSENAVERPVKRAKPKKAKRRVTDEANEYGLAEEPELPQTPPESEPEKEWQPPKFAWDDTDDDATPYLAKAPEVEIQKVIPKEVTEVKESELKLLRRDEDNVREPKQAWTPELLTDFLSDQLMWSQFGLAVVILIVDGLMSMVFWWLV